MHFNINILMTGRVASVDPLCLYMNQLIELQEQSLINNIFFENNSSWSHISKNLLDHCSAIEMPLSMSDSLPPRDDDNYHNCMARLKSYKKKICLDFIRQESGPAEETYIIYARPDVYLDISLIRDYIILLRHPNGNDIFKNKIWIANYDLLKPLYINDLTYFGHIDDLCKLNSYREYKRWNYGISHIREFISPFLAKYPILERYIENESNIFNGLYSKSDNDPHLDIRQSLSKDSFYAELLSVYYQILNRYFFTFGHRFRWDDPREDAYFDKSYIYDEALGFFDNIDNNMKYDHTFYVYRNMDHIQHLENRERSTYASS